MVASALTCAVLLAVARDQSSFIATWATSPAGLPTVEKIGTYIVPAPIKVEGTIRYRLRISQGGRALRLKFSNEYNENPLNVAAVSVGITADGFDAAPQSLARVTFGGSAAITIPPGAPALSDIVAVPVKPLTDLLVSVFIPGGMPVFPCTKEWPPTDQVVVEALDTTLADHLPASKCLFTWRPIVSEVDVSAERHPGKVVVALGDSITDGEVDPKTGERGWPAVLARRLYGAAVSVVNAGIGGNRLLGTMPMCGAAAVARLDRDVLSVPGLTHIVVLEGINDIRMSGPRGVLGDTSLVKPEDLIAAYLQIIERAHERGIRIIGATILPFEGADYYSASREQVRETINRWIRSSKGFDGVIDFDAGTRDPTHPLRLKAEYDIGDHLHPNATGYRAMGEMVDVRLFN